MPDSKLRFDHRWLTRLPVDPEVRNFCRQVYESCASRVTPTPVSAPALVCHSAELANQLGLADWLRTPEAVQVLSGNRLLPGMEPFATCYGGHQFGQWAGQLGDGRAINLGELITADDSRWILQLKGAGRTPYSRAGDGLAVLRSSLREFLCSEAMHFLGVPTTRALSLALTGEQVVRDMFYDGHPRQEPGAIVCRVAKSFTRFGHFEIFARRQDVTTLRKLVDYTIEVDFPHLDRADPLVVSQWFGEVCSRTAAMTVHWMRVGFVHGVMNTDNMSILGETIDYGPYGWIDAYEPNWTPNTTDAVHHRYAFEKQPAIAHWNLWQLANALWPVIEKEEPLQQGLERYASEFHQGYEQMMASKLGLLQFDEARDRSMIEELDQVLQVVETDMTLFYRGLSKLAVNALRKDSLEDSISWSWIEEHVGEAFYSQDDWTTEKKKKVRNWMFQYVERLLEQPESDDIRNARMQSVNPCYVLRNYIAQQAIDLAEQGDYSEIETLIQLLKRPYEEQPGMERYTARRPEWARHKPGCSMLSCRS